MKDNLFQAQYDVTKKSKIKKFYDSNKILIISCISILVILIASFSFYSQHKEKKKIFFSENYVKAKIYLANGDKDRALNILKEVVYADDPTYSTLCFFLILNENLINNYKELSELFDHVLQNNKFEKEVRNLLIYKKVLFSSNYITEPKLLDDIKPLLNDNTLWKPHALLLLGDYFVDKKEYLKAKEFYTQILLIKNLQKDLYDQAIFQLSLIADD